jgi:serine phosphatase RsbU (regulator of sigma subunit)
MTIVPEGHAMLTEKRQLRILHILRYFFRIAAPVFVLVTFSIRVDLKGSVWIMWRDQTLLAATLFVIGGAFAAAWWWIHRRICQRTASPDDSFSAPEPFNHRQAYNIWRDGDPGLRRRFAMAAFFMFSALGPMLALGMSTFSVLSPAVIALTTISSGCIAGSVILFGKRRLIMVFCVVVFSLVNVYSEEIAAEFGFPSVRHPQRGTAVGLSPQEVTDIIDQRSIVSVLGILCIAAGYTVFISVLSVEGRKRVRLEAEMTIAQKIQKMLLPARGLSCRGYELAGATTPAAEVGGDYFDHIVLPDGRIAAVVADVAGHGVGAGIISAMTKSALRTQLAIDPQPSGLLTRLNRSLSDIAGRKTFVTMAYMLLDPEKHVVRFATAGHPPALLFRPDSLPVELLRTPSLALGLSPDATYHHLEVTLGPGEMFVMYTDGITEARGRNGEMLGIEGLTKILSLLVHESAADVARDAMKGVRDIVAGGGAIDDLTIVVAKGV